MSCRFTFATATTPPSSDRYIRHNSAQHVWLSQNSPIKPRKRIQKLDVQTRLQVNLHQYRHLLKDILRKDYKKNKENNKETIATEKNTLERIRDITKN